MAALAVYTARFVLNYLFVRCEDVGGFLLSTVIHYIYKMRARLVNPKKMVHLFVWFYMRELYLSECLYTHILRNADCEQQ